MRGRTTSITLLELLIAMAVFGVIIALLGQILVGSMRSYDVNEHVSEERQEVQTVEELLRYELGLAGYRCTDDDAREREFTGPTIEVDDASGSDAIRVRYFEDRYGASACDENDVTITVADGELVRIDNEAGTTSSLVEGVTNLEVIYWLDDSNSQFRRPVDESRPPDDALAGIGLTATLEEGPTNEIAVSFRNPQCARVDDCL